MTGTVLLNVIFALGIVTALAVACRLPYRLAAKEPSEESGMQELSRRDDNERLAA